MSIITAGFLFLWLVFAWFNFRKAVIMLPLAFPLYMWRFGVLGMPFTLVEGMVYLAFLVFLVRLIKKQEKWEWHRFYGSVGLILIGAVLSLVVVPKFLILSSGEEVMPFRAALGILKGWIVNPMLFLVMWMSVLRQKGSFYRGFYFYVAGAVVLALIGLYQVVFKDFVTIDGRASGPFQSANYLAFYLVPGVIFLALFLSSSRSAGCARMKLSARREFKSFTWERIKCFFFKAAAKKERLRFWGMGLVGLILVLALVFSVSYAAWLGVFAGLLFYFLNKRKRVSGKRLEWRQVMGGLLGILILGGIFWTQIGTQKFQSFLDFSRQSSSSVRIEVWRTAGFLIQKSPFLGIGLGQFENQYQLHVGEALGHVPYESKILHPHNLFLTFWLYTGVIGLFGLVWLLIEAYGRLGRKKNKEIVLICLTILTAILVHGLFDTPFWKNDLAYLWWMVIGGVFSGD